MASSRSKQVALTGALACLFGLLALVAAGGAGADSSPAGQFLWWNDTGDGGNLEVGPGSSIVISMGQMDYITTCGFRLAHKEADKRGQNDFIYPATDVYIVEHGSVDPNAAPVGFPAHDADQELSDAADSPNTINGVTGGVFIDELIGSTGSKFPLGTHQVPPGTYDIVYDECQDGDYQASMDPLFENALTVTANGPVPLFPPTALLTAKAVAFVEMKAAEKLASYLEKLIDSAYEAAAYEGDPTVKYIKSLGTKTILADPGAVTVLLWKNQGAHYKGIYQDPPDANYKQVTLLGSRQQVDARTTDPLHVAIAATGTQADVEDQLAAALLHAMERYQGAQAAGDGEWSLIHAREIQDFATRLGSQTAAKVDVLTALRDAISADTRPLDANAAVLGAYTADVRAHGLSDDAIRTARNYGLDAAALANLQSLVEGRDFNGFGRAQVVADLNQISADTAQLETQLNDVAAGFQPVIDALHADEGVPEQAPTVRAGGPYTAAVGTSVTLDGTGSNSNGGPYALTSYAWDLNGDGVFDDATGATVSYTPTRAYSGLIGLKVTNDQGRWNVGYAQLTATDGNHAPDFSLSTPPLDPTLAVGGLELFNAVATDADGDPVTIHWRVDGADTGATGAIFSYSAGAIGVHAVQAEADDGKGGTTDRTWIVTVLANDGDGDGWNANVDCVDTDPDVHPKAVEVVGNGVNDDCEDATPDTGSPPRAAFAFTSSAAGHAIPFVDGSTDPNADITGWAWTFGDLTPSSTEPSPTHTYAAPGTYTVTLTLTDATGSHDTVSHDVVVTDAPIADFTFVPGAPAVGGSVAFTDTSHETGGTIVGWSWTFGDGDTSTEQSPEHVYLAAGDFDVTLVVTDSNGVTGTLTKTVSTVVGDPGSAPLARFQPLANRNLADGTGTAPATVVAFSDSCNCGDHTPRNMLDDVLGLPWAAPGSGDQWAIIKLKGDGTAPIDRIGVQPRADCCFEQRVKNFTVEASNDGVTFTQILAATTANDGTLQYFDVPVPVGARYIKYRPQSNWGCCWYSTSRLTAVTDHSGPKTVSFANSSINATSYRWSFGDGGTSTSSAPSHTYAVPGTYTVTLTARSADGRSSSTSTTYTANGLVPSFTYSPASPPAGAAVAFDDTSATLGVAEASAEWDFGDGTTLTGAHVSHTYATGGAYTVRLTVVDDGGGSSSTTRLVTVGGSSAGPVALFSPRQPGGQSDVARDFRGGAADATSTNGGRQPASTLLDGDVNNGQWWTTDRGPGQSLTLSFPATRVIEGVGLYIYGGWWEMVHDFDVSVSTTTPDTSAFTTVFHGTTAWETRWQDFAFPAIKARYVRITPRSVSYDPGYTCCYSLAGVRVPSGSDGGPTVTFHNLSQGASTYAWDFGDGTTSTDAEPTHTYAAGGTYTVTLTATKAGGGTSTYSAEQVVRSAGFSWAPASPTSNDLVQFTDTTAAALGEASVLWQFDDGTTSVFANPLKQFAPGTHNVTLTVTDREGRTWSVQHAVVVTAGTTRAAFAPQGAFNAAADISGATVLGVSSTYQYDGCWGGPSILDRNLNNCGWATLYPTGGAPAWARVSLAPAPGGAPWTINSVTVTSQVDSPPQRPARFELAVSDSPDPASFKAVYQSEMANTAAPQVFTLPRPVQARYIEYRTFGNFGGSCCTGTSRLTVESGQITENRTVVFANTSQNADSYSWDFGDGQTSTSAAATVSHHFAAAGSYTVKLTACAAGACDTSTVVQRVLDPVTASFAFNGLSSGGTATEGQSIQLADTTLPPGAGTVSLVDWNFGDGATAVSTGASSATSHSWPDNGTYTVTETITTSLQQSATVSRQLTVLNATPTVDLGPDRSFYESRVLDFSFPYGDAGANESLQCTYDTGDGTAPTAGACGRFQYEYPAGARAYTITVTIRDKDGASASDTLVYTTVPRAQSGYASTDFTGKFPGSVFPAPGNCCGPIGVVFDSSNNLYVSDYPTGFIYRFDSHGGVPNDARKLPNTVGCSPSGLAFSKAGRLYAARQACGDVVEVDPVNGGVLRVVAGGIGCATGLATDPISGDLFVTQPCYYTDLKRISHFEDGGPVSVTGGFGCCGGIDGITIGPDGTMWLEINGYLGKVDATSSATPGRTQFLMPIPTFDGVAIAASTDPSQPSYIYANRNDGIITKIDLSTATPTLTDIFVGGTRGDFVAVGADGCLYATQSDRIVKVTFADGTCGLASTSVVPQLGLAPANANGTLGTPHTVTATLTNVVAPLGTLVTFAVTGANTLSGTALADASGTARFSYNATNPGQDTITATSTAGATNLTSNPATVTWTRPPNVPPAGGADDYSVHFGQTLHVAAPGVLGNDTDDDGNPLTASAMPQLPQHGQALLAATGELTYTPAPGFVGDDTFTYTPHDGTVAGAPVTVTIHVTDAAPTPAPDTFTTLQGQTLTIDNPGVLANDSDPDGDSLTRALLVGQAAHGHVVLAFAGGFIYTPDAGFSGADSFTYTVGDGVLESAPVTVTILVDGPPVAVPDAFTTHQAAPLDIPYAALTGNDSDPEGEPVFVVTSSATGASHGTLTIGATSFTYTPERGFAGDDTFSYRITDGRAQSAPATVTVHVTDNAPVAVGDAYSVQAGHVLHVALPGPLANDSDPDGDSVSVASGTQPGHGTYLLSADGELTYTPDAGFAGTDTLTYIATDGALASAPATITIDVTNAAPAGAADTYSVHLGQTLHVPAPGVLGNDTDSDGDSLTASTMPVHPLHGLALLAATGELSYISEPGYVGDDSFTYTPNDGVADGTPVTVTIHVTDGAPVATPDSATVLQGDSVDGNVLTNDSDPDGDPLTVALFSGPAHGSVGLAPDGSYTYTSAPDAYGTETFTYLLSDGGISVPGTVTIDVRPRNRPPVVSLAPAGPVDEGTAIPLTASGSDPDAGQSLTYSWTVSPNASLVPAGAHASFTSDDGPATATVTVRACDDGSPSACAEDVRQIEVRNVAPSVSAAAAPAPQVWGLPVHFTGAGADPSHADMLAGLVYRWSFGDLALSPANVVDHTYAAPGTYVSELSALDKDGGLGSKRVSVSITKRPTSIGFTAPLTQPFGPTELSAQLVDGADPASALLAGRLLTFVAGGHTYSATTNAAGIATVTPPPFLLSGPVTVSFGGNALYLPSATTVQLTIANAFGNGPGFFTLGDRTATTGTVSWWTSQWEKANVLSGGAPPPSFKGYVNAPALTGCGTGVWTTGPGNSSGPPASVGPYVAVVVASRITKSGSTISGTVVHILAVKTAPGYGPAPGHDGTGQVVGTVC